LKSNFKNIKQKLQFKKKEEYFRISSYGSSISLIILNNNKNGNKQCDK